MLYVTMIFIMFVQGVADSVQSQEDDSVLKCLIEMAEYTPKFLRPAIEQVFPFCLKVGIFTFIFNSFKGIHKASQNTIHLRCFCLQSMP